MSLTVDQIAKLDQMEQDLKEIIDSPEFQSLELGDYHPDLHLVDALSAISYLLDYCVPSSKYPEPLAKFFDHAALNNRLQILEGEQPIIPQ